MAWTTPPTFVAGATLTAAQLNQLSGDLAMIGGAWTSYVPTTTNVALGNGTVTGRYKQVDKTVDFQIVLTFGSTTTLSGSPTFTLPATAFTSLWATTDCTAWDLSATNFYSIAAVASSTTVVGTRTDPAVAGNTLALLSSTNPFTWATGDVLTLNGRYEAA